MTTALDLLRATSPRPETPFDGAAARSNMESLAREVAVLAADLAAARAEGERLRGAIDDVLTLVGEPLRATLSQVLAVTESSLVAHDHAPGAAARKMAQVHRHAQSMLWRVSAALSSAGSTTGGWMPPPPAR